MEIIISNEKLVTDYGKLVSSLCHRMVFNNDLIEDATQEVWLEILKSIKTFNGNSKISTWIYKIAYRVIIRFALKEKEYYSKLSKKSIDDKKMQIPVNVDYNNDIIVKEMCDKCLTGSLNCLDEEQRLAYLFREIIQLPYKEISQILDKSDSTIRKMVSRAKEKLNNFLNNQCALYNEGGNCTCRAKKIVQKVNLDIEYKKLKKINNEINLYLASEKILPRKNYWLKYI